MTRLGILISGRGSNFEAIAFKITARKLDARIAVVISNRADARGLEKAKAHGIPAVCIPSKGVPREEYDLRVAAELKRYEVDLVCLAGYMRLLTPAFIREFPMRVLNIHPSLLPELRGLQTHERALAAGLKEHGCTVHFVEPELDAGPIIAQARVRVLPGDDADALARRVLAEEHKLYPRALAAVAAGLVGARAS